MTTSEEASGGDYYGWFAPPDLDLLFNALTKLGNPGNVVLVGGQSLSFWVDHYNIPIPETDTPFLTQDADFLATKNDAETLAELLGGKLRLATIADITPNVATLVFDGSSGQKLLIDFLGVVVGLSSEEIRKKAVPIARDGQEIFILHPILCLKSRISNLRTLPSKRNKNGIEQARVAVEVARHYLDQRLAEGENRAALIATTQLVKYAQSKDGLYVWERYGIDILKAVDPQMIPFEMFQKVEWPKQVKKTEDLREKNKRRKEQQEKGRLSYSTKKHRLS